MKNKLIYLFRKIEDNSLFFSKTKEKEGKLLAEFNLTKPITQREVDVLNLIQIENISNNQLNKIGKILELEYTGMVLLKKLILY